jgi:nitroimidazol reductase NimA-like FMN-containing flavoprotein (pyridoxamine 5'-phosphate oxidase superfamily)
MSNVQGSTRRQRTNRPTRSLSAGECRDWLTSHREGRLAYQTGRGPRSVVVSYAVTDRHIMFRLPDYNDIVHYAPGERVTLEVEGVHAPVQAFESVSVTGEAQLAVEDDPAVLQEAQFEEQWPAGVRTSVICLPITEMVGFQEPTALRQAQGAWG